MTSGDRLGREALIEAASTHQVRSHGLSGSAPDRCGCGADVFPAAALDDYEDISSRRDRAFAAHQLSQVLPLIEDAIEAQERLPYAMQRSVRRGDAALVRSLIPAETEEA